MQSPLQQGTCRTQHEFPFLAESPLIEGSIERGAGCWEQNGHCSLLWWGASLPLFACMQLRTQLCLFSPTLFSFLFSLFLPLNFCYTFPVHVLHRASTLITAPAPAPVPAPVPAPAHCFLVLKSSNTQLMQDSGDQAFMDSSP